MKVVVPNKLTILSTTLEETDATDAALWSASTTYTAGQRVRYNHVLYESLLDGNRGNQPDGKWSGLDAKWKKIGATNAWKMIDEFVDTQSLAPLGQNLSFCVPFSRADSFAFLNVAGRIASAKVYDLDEDEDNQLLFDSGLGLIKDIYHLSLYEYNYSPVVSEQNSTTTGLPMPINGKLCVEMEPGGDGYAGLGLVIVGREYTLGLTEYDVELGFTDYSRKETDEFGVTTFVRRSSTNHMSLPIYVVPDQVDFVMQKLAEVRGMACLWIGDNRDEGFKSLTVYGWLEDYRIVFEGPNECHLSLEIQGLI